MDNLSLYKYADGELNASHEYLLPELMRHVNAINLSSDEKRAFELGCGNGAIAHQLHQAGFTVTGVDPSEEGIAQANSRFPELSLSLGSAYDNLSETYGQFPLVISLEVAEHVFHPRIYTKALFNLLKPGGHAVLSTPYHGYFKNLVLAVSGKLDAHFTALWDGGHIKFWSIKTFSQLLDEAGFEILSISRVGRIPSLAKSMVFLIRKPAA